MNWKKTINFECQFLLSSNFLMLSKSDCSLVYFAFVTPLVLLVYIRYPTIFIGNYPRLENNNNF
jgi:hypothetical protein